MVPTQQVVKLHKPLQNQAGVNDLKSWGQCGGFDSSKTRMWLRTSLLSLARGRLEHLPFVLCHVCRHENGNQGYSLQTRRHSQSMGPGFLNILHLLSTSECRLQMTSFICFLTGIYRLIQFGRFSKMYIVAFNRLNEICHRLQNASEWITSELLCSIQKCR